MLSQISLEEKKFLNSSFITSYVYADNTIKAVSWTQSYSGDFAQQLASSGCSIWLEEINPLAELNRIAEKLELKWLKSPTGKGLFCKSENEHLLKKLQRYLLTSQIKDVRCGKAKGLWYLIVPEIILVDLLKSIETYNPPRNEPEKP